MMKTEFAELLGLKGRLVLDWTSKGYLIPAEQYKGKGKISYYDEKNAVQAKILQRVSKAGVKLSAFAGVFQQLGALLGGAFDPFDETLDEMDVLALYVKDDNTVGIWGVPAGKEIPPGPLRNFNTVIIVNLQEVLQEVRHLYS